LVGEKAYGLSSLPKAWTLPFVVVSDKLLTNFKTFPTISRPSLIDSWAVKIVEAALAEGIAEGDNVIIRSSGCSEGLDERGKFHSVPGRLNDFVSCLTHCLQKLESDSQLKTFSIPLVVQKHVVAVSSKGHLSNERRCYEEKRDWLGQFEDTKHNNPCFVIALREWRTSIAFDEFVLLPLTCNLTARISEVLKIPATWGWKNNLRLHFEWVWDGQSIYIVQADQETNVIGIDPTRLSPSMTMNGELFDPICLAEINEQHAEKYNKIHNVFTYMKLNLSHTKFYVLDRKSVIDELSKGNEPAELTTDLEKLVKGSLVIRMDIATDDKNLRQLLPRTHEVRSLSQALIWLVGVASHLSARPVLPWYHEPFDAIYNTRTKTSRTKTPFDKSLVIRTSNDVELLSQEAEKPTTYVRRVRIQPTEEELLRDKGTLRTIGELVKKIDAVILLEGGVLSHAYYQLVETGAVVEVLHPFDNMDENPQEFYASCAESELTLVIK
jgi:hypothetical protein